jgi:hypothetical protein
MNCIAQSEEMASLNDKDRKWLSTEISNKVTAAFQDNTYISDKIAGAVESFKPKGWGKFTNWLRSWGAVGSAMTGAIALLALAITALVFAVTESGRNSEFRGSATQHLTNIDRTLAEIKTKLAAANPSDPANQQAAKELLAEATPKSLIPEATAKQAGDRFIKASKEDSNAWDVALRFVSYRSSLNVPSAPAGPWAKFSGSVVTEYRELPVPGKPRTQVRWSTPIVSPDKAARWDFIGQDKNVNVKAQPAWLIAEGGASRLDDEQIRNVVFDRVEIHYSGRPVILENVIFINCTFVFDNDDRGRQLAQAVLDSPAVTFRLNG